MRTIPPKILDFPREKLKENFREKIFENLGMPREVALFIEILENAVQFAS